MIKTTTVQDVIYERLLEDIISGKMQPGSKLVLSSIAKQFDVSIMPVREALMRLEAGKYVVIERNRKIVVNQLSAENLRNILEARLVNECYLAEKSALRRSEESIEKLERLHEEIKEITDIKSYLRSNREFHFTIYDEAGAPVVVDIIRPLWERVYPYLHILFEDDPNWNNPEWIRNHEKILEGMKEKSVKLVTEWLKKDLVMAAEKIITMLEKSREQNIYKIC